MLKGNTEIRMIWLMILIIVGGGAWFLEVNEIAYLCGLVFVMSVMQYVDSFAHQVDLLNQKTQTVITLTSKVPMYIASIIAVVGSIMNWHFIVTVAITAWIYFFLRWLKRLEFALLTVQSQIQKSSIESRREPSAENQEQSSDLFTDITYHVQPQGFFQQIKIWVLTGNPVLKIAILILVIGIILLLRFATENWQLSLSLKLTLVSLSSLVVVGVGYALQAKNRSFSLALEGLGLAGLFLTLFFAYYNLVIPSLIMASGAFIIVMALTLYLSLKQQSVELALMAMMIAYVAPFTLPVRNATATELLSYYLVINIAVAILSTLRPWKFLNQIAFLMTALVGGGYAFIYGDVTQRSNLTLLVLIHTLVFIWLGFRFSQLLAKEDLKKFQLNPILDIGLIFGAPIVGYLYLYLMYFNEMLWQAGLSLVFATIFAVLYRIAITNKVVPWIAQSYLSLVQIFLVLIPPILLPEYWSIVGWAVEGVLIFMYALYKNTNISRYLSMGLLVVAGVSSLFYLIKYSDVPNTLYWILATCYFVVVFMSNFHLQFQKQLSAFDVAFLSVLMLAGTILILLLFQDQYHGALTTVYSLVSSLIIYVILNELLQRREVSWGWLLPKWIGLVPIHIFAFILVFSRTHDGVIHWESSAEQGYVLLSGLLLTSLWLRPLLGVRAEKEWVSFGILSSLAFASLTLIPHFPYMSVVILPLIFCFWCYWRVSNSDWKMFWQARTTLALMMTWIITSQLFATQIFKFYFMPILNPFDLVSIAMLIGFMWMLSLQVKVGLDRGIASVMAVLGLLWLSSYIVLRALHMYLNTPINDLSVWSNSTIQLSFTLLWVVLAFITMSIATRKKMRALWILGGSILFIVTLKLVLLDLSHIGTLTRVISFLGAGFIMLIIAYIAPIPTEQEHYDHSA